MRKNLKKQEITVPAHIDYLAELRDFVVKIGHKGGFSDKVVGKFKLSIDEAVTNVIKHGYADSNGTITLRTVVNNDSMTVFLVDQGKYFDPLHVKAPDLPRYVNIRKKGGLGIFIIRKLMDSIEYRKTSEGNELRMTKLRNGSPNNRLGIHIPTLSIDIKARYSIIMSAILTAVVLLGYIYYYFHWESVIIEDTLNQAKRISQSLSTILSKTIDLETGELDEFRIGEIVLQKKTEHSDIVKEIAISHSTGYTLYATSDKLFWESYKPPGDAIEIEQNIYSYNYANQIPVYELIWPIKNSGSTNLGYLHILYNQDYAISKITGNRQKDLRTALLVLLFGYLGIVLIVFVILSPFQKLAEWVRVLGRGEEINEKMDIGESGEVGEIAKAFSDITTKFKKSQESLVRQEQLQKEMQVAQEIQQTLLPSESPVIDGYEIGSFYEAAKEVGGDYFDFVEVAKDTLGIVVADVSGKGVPGSLVMTMIRTTLRTEARGLKVASQVLSKVNKYVVDDMKKGMFVTVYYVIIDSKRRRLNYASAGHNPMILYRGSTKKTYYLNPRGFPIGISLPDDDLFKNSLESDTIQLVEDDILLMYTDGITEAMNSRREMFGEGRLHRVIREYGHLPVEPFVEKIRDEIHSFTEGHPQNDDITLVVLKEETSVEKVELKRAKKTHKLIQAGKSIREACEQAGITTYAYYNKYKRKFDEEGAENYEIEDDSISLEAKHLSIEERTQIYDVIKKHPDFGAKRISEELNTELYGYNIISETRIYDELVRSRLNTRKLREAFIARERKGRPTKPPGTPLLTLDGRVIINKEPAYQAPQEEDLSKTEQKPEAEEKSDALSFKEKDHDFKIKHREYNDLTDAESLLLNPLEAVLNKELASSELVFEDDILSFTDKNSDTEAVENNEPDKKEEIIPEKDDAQLQLSEDVAFEDLLDGDSLYQESEYEEGSNEFEHEPLPEKPVEQKEAKQDPVENEEIPEEANIDEQFEDDSQESEYDFDDSIALTGVDELLTNESFWDFNQSSYEDDPDGALFEGQHTEEDTIPEYKFRTENISSNNGNDKHSVMSEEKQNPDSSYSNLLDKIEEEMVLLDEKHPDEDLVKNETSKSSSEALTIDDNGNGFNQQLLIKGLQYYHQRRYVDTIKEMKKIINKFPNMKEAYNILGNAYFRSRMYDEAAIEYERVKSIDPANLDAYENMGAIYANNGNYEKAISEWEYILKIKPNRKDVKRNIERATKILSDI